MPNPVSEQARRIAEEFFDGQHILRPGVLEAIIQKHLDAYEQGQWVSVKERLPEWEADVWIAHRQIGNRDCFLTTIAWYGVIDKKWHRLPNFLKQEDVKYWMPLPAPPTKRPTQQGEKEHHNG